MCRLVRGWKPLEHLNFWTWWCYDLLLRLKHAQCRGSYVTKEWDYYVNELCGTDRCEWSMLQVLLIDIDWLRDASNDWTMIWLIGGVIGSRYKNQYESPPRSSSVHDWEHDWNHLTCVQHVQVTCGCVIELWLTFDRGIDWGLDACRVRDWGLW